MFDAFPSISPVVNMHPIRTRIIDNTFDFVIFSLNMRYAIISTKTGLNLKVLQLLTVKSYSLQYCIIHLSR